MTLLLLLLAAGDERIVKAGETLTLTEDLVLEVRDSLDVQGTPQQPCVVVGNGHSIRTAEKWTGRLRLVHAELRGLGAAAVVEGDKMTREFPALGIRAVGEADVVVESCTFDASSTVELRLDGTSRARVTGSTCRENALGPVNKMVHLTRPFFSATGSSTAPKIFQGNRVYRSNVHLTGANWDVDGNLVIGLRAGLFAYGEGTVVRGNYVHVLMPRTSEYPYWSQVSTFTTAKGALAEHNVIRDGEWIVRMIEGEFRYNVVCDINDHDLVQNGSVGRIHHNVFIAGKPEHPPGAMFACIAVIYKPAAPGGGVEIWNNTFDAGGTMSVPGVEVNAEAFVKSLRNNVFFNFAHGERYIKGAQAMVRPSWQETLPAALPDRLGYADYNLFQGGRKNYALSVAGKAERKDAGFGLNDVPRGGAVDAQADPKFQGPLPDRFPFADEDIKAGRVTVPAMLARFRELYAPAAGSPLVDAGDPLDGPGADIGAVGAGAPHPEDRFGRR
jgi:hypothetical protein